MPLKLQYPDRYRLWNSLVRGNPDRLFVETDGDYRLGDSVPLEIHVGGVSLPIVARGSIVGMRHAGRRFSRGVYLQIPQRELEKFRRFLSLHASPHVSKPARRTFRVHHQFPVRFIEPKDEEVFITKNLSETGLLTTCPPQLYGGQRVSLYLVLDDSPLRLEAEVAWASEQQRTAGLNITEISDLAAQRLAERVRQLREEDRSRKSPGPIIVADDDEQVLKVMSTALEQHGHEVYRATNGEETFDLARQIQPELLVIDILMPGIDGSEVCKAMRADAELVDIRVILVSALDADTLHTVADEAGATDYLAKPVSVAGLLELVDHYLG